MRKNRKAFVLSEILAFIAVVAVIFAIVGYLISKNADKTQYKVFVQNARQFATKVSTYRDEHVKYYNEIYLLELVKNNYIKAYQNPFGGGKYCDLYESKVVIRTSGERYVTLKCGDYLIDSQKVSSDGYQIYKVSEWKESKDSSQSTESAKLYNYKKNGVVVLENYVNDKKFIEIYNDYENQNIKDITEINSINISIMSKTFYRTKELVQENL